MLGGNLSKPDLLRTASDARERVAGWRAVHGSIALVPTMGNLHDGHLSLVKLAATRADRVILTIFVNPTQFGVGEDFAAYPRTFEADREIVERSGLVDALFVPEVDEIYPFGTETGFRVSVPALGGELCGASRPGHFDGVATVVLRLLNIVAPDHIVLGRKDYQQLVILKRMIADLRVPVEVVEGDTRRHEDGLAMSSRNHYLSTDERQSAPLLHATIRDIRDRLARGERNYAELEARGRETLETAGFRPDYVEVRLASDLEKPNGRHEPGELIVLAAAWLGKARLIDNVLVGS